MKYERNTTVISKQSICMFFLGSYREIERIKKIAEDKLFSAIFFV